MEEPCFKRLGIILGSQELFNFKSGHHGSRSLKEGCSGCHGNAIESELCSLPSDLFFLYQSPRFGGRGLFLLALHQSLRPDNIHFGSPHSFSDITLHSPLPSFSPPTPINLRSLVYQIKFWILGPNLALIPSMVFGAFFLIPVSLDLFFFSYSSLSNSFRLVFQWVYVSDS